MLWLIWEFSGMKGIKLSNQGLVAMNSTQNFNPIYAKEWQPLSEISVEVEFPAADTVFVQEILS